MLTRPALTALRPWLLALALAAPTGARADEQVTMRWTATLLEVTVGQMTLSATRKGNAYALASQTSSSGLASMFGAFKVTSRAEGEVRGKDFRPKRYESQGEGARAGRGAVMTYSGGVPEILQLAEEDREGAPKLDPASQAGKVDPLTLTYALLRDIPEGESCDLALEIFDGHRASRLTVGRPAAVEGGMVCDGLYRRMDGYTPEELAERRDFPFRVTYAALPGGGLRPVEIVLDSLMGAARLTRSE